MNVSEKEKRTIRLALLVLLPAVVLFRVLPMYRTARAELLDQLALERGTLQRERAAVGGSSRDAQLARLADSTLQAVNTRLFAGDDEVIASGRLAAYVATLARESRVKLEDASTRPSVGADSGVRTLRVEVRAESDLEGILTFLNALETGDRLVRVDRFDISKRPGTDDRPFEVLAFTATVSGFAFDRSSEATAAGSGARASGGAAATGGPPGGRSGTTGTSATPAAGRGGAR